MKSFAVPSIEGRLRYHDIAGEAPTLVFIHGLGCASSCDYPTVAAHLSLSGRRKLLIDLFGSGFSDRPISFDYSIAAHARTVAALLGHLDLTGIDLFGHSMGGAVAIAAATLLGRRLHHLALAEPNLEPGGGFFSRRIASMSERDYVASGHEALVQASRAEGNDIWAASLARSAPHAVHRSAVSLVAGSDPTWLRMLADLPVPRAMLVGERSLPYPDIEKLPGIGVALTIVPAAGHSMAWDNPSGLAEAIARASR